MPKKFPLGQLVATPGALAVLEASGVSPLELISRHASGDWGEVSISDKLANDCAVTDGTRIFSAYQLPSGERVWVITEADRSSTCVLLPSEY